MNPCVVYECGGVFAVLKLNDEQMSFLFHSAHYLKGWADEVAKFENAFSVPEALARAGIEWYEGMEKEDEAAFITEHFKVNSYLRTVSNTAYTHGFCGCCGKLIDKKLRPGFALLTIFSEDAGGHQVVNDFFLCDDCTQNIPHFPDSTISRLITKHQLKNVSVQNGYETYYLMR